MSEKNKFGKRIGDGVVGWGGKGSLTALKIPSAKLLQGEPRPPATPASPGFRVFANYAR